MGAANKLTRRRRRQADGAARGGGGAGECGVAGAGGDRPPGRGRAGGAGRAGGRLLSTTPTTRLGCRARSRPASGRCRPLRRSAGVAGRHAADHGRASGSPDRRVRAETGAGIIVPTHAGRRGNPVLWPRAYFGEMLQLEGDAGAKRLLRRTRPACARWTLARTRSSPTSTRRRRWRIREARGVRPLAANVAVRTEHARGEGLTPGRYFLFSRAIRPEVSQRPPPIFCTSA